MVITGFFWGVLWGFLFCFGGFFLEVGVGVGGMVVQKSQSVTLQVMDSTSYGYK